MRTKLTTLALAVACMAGLAACGTGSTSSGTADQSGTDVSSTASSTVADPTGAPLDATMTETGRGMSITAHNASVSEPQLLGTLTVEEGDSIVYVSRLSEGRLDVTIRSEAGEVVSERTAESEAFFTDTADPGSYEVWAAADGATGTLYLAAADDNEIGQQLGKLVETNTSALISDATSATN